MRHQACETGLSVMAGGLLRHLCSCDPLGDCWALFEKWLTVPIAVLIGDHAPWNDRQIATSETRNERPDSMSAQRAGVRQLSRLRKMLAAK